MTPATTVQDLLAAFGVGFGVAVGLVFATAARRRRA
jgi:hypothetical protein